VTFQAQLGARGGGQVLAEVVDHGLAGGVDVGAVVGKVDRLGREAVSRRGRTRADGRAVVEAAAAGSGGADTAIGTDRDRRIAGGLGTLAGATGESEAGQRSDQDEILFHVSDS